MLPLEKKMVGTCSIFNAFLGVCYLYMKVVERSHFPTRLWEKVKLKKNMVEAVEQINVNLMHWDEFVRQKCKARVVRIHQYLLRMRKMELRGRFAFFNRL